MILDERSAAVFINGYQKLLLEICGPAGGKRQGALVETGLLLYDGHIAGRAPGAALASRRSARAWTILESVSVRITSGSRP